jgi:hypothetical protein
MEQLLTGNIWNQIAPKVRRRGRRLAAIAYVSDADFLRLKKNDVLVCDASDPIIKSRGTSVKALRTYLDAGVLLYNRPNLHAKVVVFGPHALIGSCNLSSWSATRLHEAAMLSTRPSIRSQALAFIYGARESGQEIDRSFIARISKIKLDKPAFVPRPKGQTRKVLGNRFWVISSVPLAEDSYADERALVAQAEKEAESRLTERDTEVDWVRWTGRSQFRALAKPGDTVMEIHRVSKNRAQVYQPAPILVRQARPKWTRIYYEVPTNCPYVPWNEFERKLERVGIKSITKNSTKELSSRDKALVETIWTDA